MAPNEEVFAKDSHQMNFLSLCDKGSMFADELAETELKQRRVLYVILLSFITMLVEIVAGRLTGSMALEADGYHMASHVGAHMIAFLAYKMTRSSKVSVRMNFGTGKVLSLGGYTSAVLLVGIAVWMIFESVIRFFQPVPIRFSEAIVVAVIGLVVNLASALLLGWGSHGHHHEHHVHHHEHHGHQHDDHNYQSAIAHVLADALTSFLAILALVGGQYLTSAAWLDPLMGIIGALVILRWAWSLVKKTALELVDAHPQGISLSQLKQRIETDGHRVRDLHLWSQGRNKLVGLLSVVPASDSVKTDFHKYFSELSHRLHLSVEVAQPDDTVKNA